jgi:uncharacterized OB-fold protein
VTPARPRPVPDLQTEPYWRGLLGKALLVQACESCSARIHPSMPCCPKCLNTDLAWIEVSGDAVVVSYCIVAQPFVAGFKVPYAVVRVSLVDAPDVELIANVASHRVSDIEIGALLHVWYDVVDDDLVLADFDLVTNSP